MTTTLADVSRRGQHLDVPGRLPMDDLVALTEVGLAIVRAQLDVDALCELVYTHVARIVDAHGFHLGLFEGTAFALKVWVQDGERKPPASFPGAQETGIVGWMRSSQVPLLVRDFEAEMESLPARPSYVSQQPPRSAVFVPLVAGDAVVGSMSVQHPEPDVFDEQDLRILEIIANQAASAVVNARLYATAQRRAEQLAAVVEVGRAITAVLDLDELLTVVVELIRERFGYYHVQVFLVENETHRAVFRASSGHQLNALWRREGRSQRFGEGIIGWVAGSGEPLLANDVSQEPRYIADDPRLLPDTRSELAVPLKLEEEVLGVLDVQSKDLGALSEDDLYVLNALANQVAVAVDAAWSYRAQQEEAWMTTVLLQVAESTNRAESLDDVLGVVTRLVPMLTGVATCGVWLRDPELDAFDLVDAYGMTIPLDEAQEQLRFHRSNVSSLLMVLLDNPQPVELAQKSDGDLLPGGFWQVVKGDQAVLLPLQAQSRRFGSLIVTFDSEEVPIRLQGKRLSMLSGIANQAAAAIENVRLATAHEEEAWISWALLEVSRAISVTPDADDMLDHVVRLIPLLAGVNRCAVFLVEPSSGDFVRAKEYVGHGSHAGGFDPWRLVAGDLPLLDLVLATRRPQRVDDTAASDLVPATWSDRVGSKTLMALPLIAQEAVLGVLLVDDVENVHVISQRREDILGGIAQQVGLALGNFHLQAQERERARLAQELQVAQRIQASYLSQEIPHVEGYSLARSWQSAREVGGDFYDFMRLAHGRLGLLVADVADKGMPAALFMATSLILLRVSAHNHDDPRAVLERSNDLIGANNQADMFVTAWYGVLDPVKHVLDFANAGHSLALLVRARDGEILRLRTPGMPLGIFADPQVGRSRLELASGDAVVLYTDGVVDALDEGGAEFGHDRLESILFGNYSRSAQEILDAVVTAVRRHMGTTPIFDDITLMVVKRQD